MALNETLLEQAIYEALAAEECFVDFTGHGEVSEKTLAPKIRIHASEPSFPAGERHLAFTIGISEPLVPNSPLSNCFRSTVWFYSIAERQDAAKYLADQVQCFFTVPPTSDRCWYRDITNDCITNNSTRYDSRLNTTRRGTTTSETESDSWMTPLVVEFIWCLCGCDKVPCEQEPPKIRPIEQSDLPECCEDYE